MPEANHTFLRSKNHFTPCKAFRGAQDLISVLRRALRPRKSSSKVDGSDLTPSSFPAPLPLAKFPRATHRGFLSSSSQPGPRLKAGDKATAQTQLEVI